MGYCDCPKWKIRTNKFSGKQTLVVNIVNCDNLIRKIDVSLAGKLCLTKDFCNVNNKKNTDMFNMFTSTTVFP